MRHQRVVKKSEIPFLSFATYLKANQLVLVDKKKHLGSDVTLVFWVHFSTFSSPSFCLLSLHIASPEITAVGIMSRNPLSAASSVPRPAPPSSISLPPPAILGFLLTPRTLTGARQWRRRRRCSFSRGRCVCSLANTAEQSWELVRDSPLYLVQQTASGPAAVVGELFEAGNWVHTKEVLVGLLVGQVELAHIGFGQNGFEDVVFVWVIDDVLEHLIGVAKPAQLVIVGLKVAVHQEGMDAHTDAMLTDESNLVLHLILYHLQGRGERMRRGRSLRH